MEYSVSYTIPTARLFAGQTSSSPQGSGTLLPTVLTIDTMQQSSSIICLLYLLSSLHTPQAGLIDQNLDPLRELFCHIKLII